MARWKAGLLALVSLLVPGLGHALAGRARPALAIAAAALAWQLGFLAVQATEEIGRGTLVLGAAVIVLGLAGAIGVAVDAWRQARRGGTGGWRHRLILAAAALAPAAAMLALPGEPLAWRSYYVPSASMLPTLPVGERFIVQEGWYATRPPRRGDVAVFTRPGDGMAYVKRIIGLPGDEVRMLRGRLVLNGAVVPHDALPPVAGDPPGGTREVWHLPDGPAVVVLRLHVTDTTPPFRVPDGHVFVMGDHVENSADSRFDPRLRYIPFDVLVGRAAITYWPLTQGRFGRRIR